MHVRPKLGEKTFGDPAVPFRPCERTLLVRLARRKVVDSRPGGRLAERRAIIVTTGVIDVPPKSRRREAFCTKPVGHRHAIERRRSVQAHGAGNRELSGGTMPGHAVGKTLKLRTIR